MREDLQHHDQIYNISLGNDIPDDVEEDSLTHVYLGASQKSETVDKLPLSHENDVAFSGFSTRLKKFLRDYLPQDHIPTCGRIEIKGEKVSSELEYTAFAWPI